MCKSKKDAEEIYDKLKPYLESRGLELEPSKIRVVEITKGFDFLSFNIRIYQILLDSYTSIFLAKAYKKIR